LSTNYEGPDQKDINKIKSLLEDIRSLLEGFINEDFEHLATPEFIDEINFVRAEILPIIHHTLNESQGYIDHHRYDLSFKDGLRTVGFLAPQVDFKKRWFDKFKSTWNQVKRGPIQIARRFAGVLFDEIDTILGSLAKVIPVLEPLIEVKEHLKNAVSAQEARSTGP
jgi:hypothetical protein